MFIVPLKTMRNFISMSASKYAFISYSIKHKSLYCLILNAATSRTVDGNAICKLTQLRLYAAE